jgi:hypothetical protein
MELKEDSSFKVKFTGTNCIKHYMIPVSGLEDFEEEELVNFNAAGTKLDELEPEPE